MLTVFVYGTLKRGFCRSAYLREQEFMGTAVTQPIYGLVDCGAYPGLIDVRNLCDSRVPQAIHGEIYRIDSDCLRELDLVEDIDNGLYRFDQIQIKSFNWKAKNLKAKIPQSVYAYFYSRDSTNLPDCGNEWTKK